MNSSLIEKLGVVMVLGFSATVLIVTPWPSTDQLLGIDPTHACSLLPKPHPDCPATNGTRPLP
jgi:hypothetical protein